MKRPLIVAFSVVLLSMLAVTTWASSQVALVDATNRTHNPYRQLGGTHFHREHSHRQALIQGHVLRNIDRQGGLPH